MYLSTCIVRPTPALAREANGERAPKAIRTKYEAVPPRPSSDNKGTSHGANRAPGSAEQQMKADRRHQGQDEPDYADRSGPQQTPGAAGRRD